MDQNPFSRQHKHKQTTVRGVTLSWCNSAATAPVALCAAIRPVVTLQERQPDGCLCCLRQGRVSISSQVQPLPSAGTDVLAIVPCRAM